MKLTKFIFSILFLTLLGCQQNRVKRLLPGSWNMVSHKKVDQFSFMQDCNGVGTLELGDYQKNNGSFHFTFSSTCSPTNYSWNESGKYQVIEQGQDFLFIRSNSSSILDTIKYQIFIVTSTDLKIGFRDVLTNESHEFLFSRI